MRGDASEIIQGDGNPLFHISVLWFWHIALGCNASPGGGEAHPEAWDRALVWVVPC